MIINCTDLTNYSSLIDFFFSLAHTKVRTGHCPGEYSIFCHIQRIKVMNTISRNSYLISASNLYQTQNNMQQAIIVAPFLPTPTKNERKRNMIYGLLVWCCHCIFCLLATFLLAITKIAFICSY